MLFTLSQKLFHVSYICWRVILWGNLIELLSSPQHQGLKRTGLEQLIQTDFLHLEVIYRVWRWEKSQNLYFILFNGSKWMIWAHSWFTGSSHESPRKLTRHGSWWAHFEDMYLAHCVLTTLTVSLVLLLYGQQCRDSYSSIVNSYLLHITFEKSNAFPYILLYFLKKSNIITVTYYILLYRTFFITLYVLLLSNCPFSFTNLPLEKGKFICVWINQSIYLSINSGGSRGGRRGVRPP